MKAYQDKKRMVNLAEQIIHDEKTYVLQSYARPEFVLVRGEGMSLYDDTGKAYQDWVAGIAVNALGYNDEGVRNAINEQLDKGIVHTSNLYHTEPHTRLARLLVTHTPFADRVFFSNSGAEANEGAMKLARRVAHAKGIEGKHEVVAFTSAFHGRTMGALAVTPKEKYQAPFRPMLSGVTIAEYNNIESARAAITDKTASVIVEPLQGEGGIHSASDAFLRALRDLCDQHDALLIFDEVQCGMGRTGELWAHSASGVQPDMMTIAKPLAAGLPIGAILMTQAVADAIHVGEHGTTFGGGALVTHVAAHVLERIAKPDFLAHVREVGAYLLERLSEINSPLIVEVRGRGLMVGLELKIEVAPLVRMGYDHGLLMVNAGTHVIRFVPPLIAQKADVDYLVEHLSQILAKANGD